MESEISGVAQQGQWSGPKPDAAMTTSYTRIRSSDDHMQQRPLAMLKMAEVEDISEVTRCDVCHSLIMK